MEDLLLGVFLDDAVVNTLYIAIHITSPCKSVRSPMTINICFFRFGNIEYILYLLGQCTITLKTLKKIDYVRNKIYILGHNEFIHSWPAVILL
jgi:hypothetical protein